MPANLNQPAFTVTFVIVDDWYQAQGHQYLQGKAGSKPEFGDSEMLTLMLVMDILSYSSERRFYPPSAAPSFGAQATNMSARRGSDVAGGGSILRGMLDGQLTSLIIRASQ